MKTKKNYQIINRWENQKFNNSVMVIESGRYGAKEYFLITMDIDTKTIQPKDKTQPFTYEHKRYENDSICGYTSRPLDYISQEAKEEAEKILFQNLRKLRKIIKNCNHSAWYEIEKIVKQTIKHYHSDFYFHDTLFMATNPNSDFILSINENGSHIFIYKENIDSLSYVVKNYPNSVYLYWNGKLNIISAKESLYIINDLPNFKK